MVSISRWLGLALTIVGLSFQLDTLFAAKVKLWLRTRSVGSQLDQVVWDGLIAILSGQLALTLAQSCRLCRSDDPDDVIAEPQQLRYALHKLWHPYLGHLVNEQRSKTSIWRSSVLHKRIEDRDQQCRTFVTIVPNLPHLPQRL